MRNVYSAGVRERRMMEDFSDTIGFISLIASWAMGFLWPVAIGIWYILYLSPATAASPPGWLLLFAGFYSVMAGAVLLVLGVLVISYNISRYRYAKKHSASVARRYGESLTERYGNTYGVWWVVTGATLILTELLVVVLWLLDLTSDAASWVTLVHCGSYLALLITAIYLVVNFVPSSSLTTHQYGATQYWANGDR